MGSCTLCVYPCSPLQFPVVVKQVLGEFFVKGLSLQGFEGALRFRGVEGLGVEGLGVWGLGV